MCARLDTTGLLADLVYTIFRGDTAVGREHCRLHRRSDGGYWLTDNRDPSWLFPHTLYVEISAGADWCVESLQVRLSGGVQRDASYRAGGNSWQATIQTDDATIERTVPWELEMHVDFDSVWLATLVLNRLKLAPGQARDVDVIRIELPSLEPATGRLRCECLGRERAVTPAGEWEAMHYVWGAHHLWADSRGIILATKQMIEEAPHGHKLIEYHWLG